MIEYEKLVNPAHVSCRNPPHNITEDDSQLFQHEYSTVICATTLLKLKNVDILQNTIFDLSSFHFFASFTHIQGSFTLKEKLDKLKLFFKPKLSLSDGVWITQNWTWMYFHWMTDALTRLIATEPQRPKSTVLLPEFYQAYPFVRESLDILGYEYFWFSPKKRIRVKNLTLPSHTASPGNYNDVLLNKLREKFVLQDAPSFRNIYISRKNAEQRLVKNEQALIDLLLQYNVEIHFFEEYTLQKQILLMGETKLVIGLHGAGLTNMLFMSAGGKILEIRNFGDAHNNCYFSMASALKHSYYYQQGVPNQMQTSSAIIEVDLESFEKVLISMNLTL